MRLTIKEMRKKAGLTQSELANAVGVNLSTVGNWERVVTCPDAEQIWNCAVALGCTPNDILGWYEEHPKDKPDASKQDPFVKELVACYRASTPDRKDRILDTARDAAGMSKKWPNVVYLPPKSARSKRRCDGFSLNGVADMGEHARLNGDSTGGTSTVSAACENPPVAISGNNSRYDAIERTGCTSADLACGNHPVTNRLQHPRYHTNEELLDDLYRRGFIDARTDAALQLLERVNYRHLTPYVSAVEKGGEKPTLQGFPAFPKIGGSR